MDFIKRTFPLLLGIFLLSVLVRLPQLNRPLSKHHEFCTAVSLRIMQIWYDNGIAAYGYNPVMSYGRAADKFINNSANQTGKMIDQDGNYYYVSHPPFAYYAPYFVFKLLHIRPDVLPLQIFNLFLHFLSALFVYFTICLLSFNRARSLPYRSALVGYAIYLFLPATLWFQGNVYMSDMAVHMLFIIGVYIVLKMIIRQRFYTPKYIFFYALVLALMIYTSWLGVFFAFSVFVYSLLHVQSNRGFKTLLWTTVVITLLLLRVILYQYAQINGLMAYFSEMLSRYLVRGSLADTDRGLFHFMFDYLWLFKTLLYNYVLNYGLIYLALLLFFWLAVSRKKLKIVFSENGYRFIWLSVTPILLLHVFFLNYSEHDFSTLYASLFFSVLLAILYDKIKKSGTVPLKTMRWSLSVLLVLLVVQYELINRKGSTHDKLIGQHYIAAHSGREETLFWDNSETLTPQIVFYAGKNIRFEKNTADAQAFMKKYHRASGIFFSETKEGIYATKIAPDSISTPVLLHP